MTHPKVSILIANYNNSKFIDDCINSLKKQSYKDMEIIFFDDSSKDDSLQKIKEFNKIKIIENKEKTEIGSFNQMKAYKEAFQLSKGEIILFLDSDDYFHEKKIEEVVEYFNNHKDAKIVFDLPLIKNNEKITEVKKYKKVLNTYWPYIHPQSCISLRRSVFDSMIDTIFIKNFPDIWMDFRICLYSKYVLNKFSILDKNLTYYRQIDTNISSKFSFLSKNWWKRRMQAHNYFFFFINKQKIKKKKNLDYYLTKIYNLFFN